jgi:hypothetical protein
VSAEPTRNDVFGSGLRKNYVPLYTKKTSSSRQLPTIMILMTRHCELELELRPLVAAVLAF